MRTCTHAHTLTCKPPHPSSLQVDVTAQTAAAAASPVTAAQQASSNKPNTAGDVESARQTTAAASMITTALQVAGGGGVRGCGSRCTRHGVPACCSHRLIWPTCSSTALQLPGHAMPSVPQPPTPPSPSSSRLLHPALSPHPLPLPPSPPPARPPPRPPSGHDWQLGLGQPLGLHPRHHDAPQAAQGGGPGLPGGCVGACVSGRPHAPPHPSHGACVCVCAERIEPPAVLHARPTARLWEHVAGALRRRPAAGSSVFQAGSVMALPVLGRPAFGLPVPPSRAFPIAKPSCCSQRACPPAGAGGASGKGLSAKAHALQVRWSPGLACWLTPALGLGQPPGGG